MRKAKEITTKAGKKVKFDAANIIPQQRAGEIARRRGVDDGDWVPVDPENFTAKAQQGHLRRRRRDGRGGDAEVGVLGQQPGQGRRPPTSRRTCSKKEKFPARFRNTCWSLVAPDDCVKVGANYAPKDGKLDPGGLASCRRRARTPACASRTMPRRSAGTTASSPTCSPSHPPLHRTPRAAPAKKA